MARVRKLSNFRSIIVTFDGSVYLKLLIISSNRKHLEMTSYLVKLDHCSRGNKCIDTRIVELVESALLIEEELLHIFSLSLSGLTRQKR